MNRLTDEEIDDLRNDDRAMALQRRRIRRGECPVCGEADCGGCEDDDEGGEP